MISTKPSRACLVPETLDQFHIPFIPLDHANWSGQYPYKPTVKFRISYVDDCILLHYVVTEESVAAVADDDVEGYGRTVAASFSSSLSKTAPTTTSNATRQGRCISPAA